MKIDWVRNEIADAPTDPGPGARDPDASAGQLTVQKRIRRPVSETAAGAWATLNELLQNPLTTREIWLVLGNMLSAQTFYDSLVSDKPVPETLQLNHLLQTTIAAAGSVGAKTRIFCAP